MKKVISIVIAFLIICLIYEFSILLFVKHYEYDYIYTKNKKEYKINEKYNYSDGRHIYDINIKDKDNNKYIYSIVHNFHKEKEIIKDLLVFNKDNMTCIFPIFKDDITSNVVCNVDHKQFSYTYLNEQNNTFMSEIKNQLTKNGYSIPTISTSGKHKQISNLATKLTYYTDFIPNYNILVWGYRGVFLINKDRAKVNDFLTSDVYDTRYLTISNKKMYIMNIESGMSSFDTIYAIDLKDGNKSIVDFGDKNISTNTYFNGTYKEEVYFTDCNGNHQYKFGEDKNTIEKIDSQGLIKYYDGKGLVNESVDDVSNNIIRFNNNVINEKITSLYNTSDIKKSNGHYYYKTNDGNFYLILDNNYKNPILLFNRVNMKEWKVVNDTIFGIIGNTLYSYNCKYGFRPLIIYDEFNYHTDNMFGAIYIGE